VSSRVLVWRGLDAWRAEVAHPVIAGDRLEASGTQIGVEPEPYRLDYELRTGERFVTAALTVKARGGDWERQLELVRAEDGRWTANGEDVPDVEGALDCDLGLCPLTNTMPVLRERLLDPAAEPRDFAMAWVSVPDLGVRRSEQRYEPIDARRVRFVGEHREFVAELELDEDGFVVRYPELAQRV
jgi:hypothetical protein